MINNIKPGYVNPLAMMKKGSQTNQISSGGTKIAEKRQKSLEAEKQSLQNSLVLIKGTSGNAGASEESIEFLEKKLEEITRELRSHRQATAEEWITDEVQERRMSAARSNFDRFSKSEIEQSSGCYGLRKDDL